MLYLLQDIFLCVFIAAYNTVCVFNTFRCVVDFMLMCSRGYVLSLICYDTKLIMKLPFPKKKYSIRQKVITMLITICLVLHIVSCIVVLTNCVTPALKS